MQSAGFSAVCHVSVKVGVGELTTSGLVRVVLYAHLPPSALPAL